VRHAALSRRGGASCPANASSSRFYCVRIGVTMLRPILLRVFSVINSPCRPWAVLVQARAPGTDATGRWLARWWFWVFIYALRQLCAQSARIWKRV